MRNLTMALLLGTSLAGCGGGGAGSGSSSITAPMPMIPGGNQPPIASAISLAADPSTPFVEQQLIASDPEGSPVQFLLDSPPTGTGYRDAHVDAARGVLYVTLTGTSGTVSLNYRATDGISASAPVAVQINVQTLDVELGGASDPDPRSYAQIRNITFDANRLGAPNGQAQIPRSIDLSGNLPTPGDQGNTQSCVGWAVAYAAKTYQEKIEIGWPLNQLGTTFSPSFVWNQINGGRNAPTFFSDGLRVIVNQGAATLATMPFTENPSVAPSAAALQEALAFKARDFNTLSGTSQIKAALVNRNPVIVGIDIHDNLLALVGPNSVYAQRVGARNGGHAITIVGFDDDRFGGSFKFINSWGTNWGDQGYGYIPYDFAEVINQAYVLDDATNNGRPEQNVYQPPPPAGLPNLVVRDWGASFDPVAGGAGTFRYEVINAGDGIAAAGADINLVLTTDNSLHTVQSFLVYENIPFELAPGRTALRDQNNQLSFKLPDLPDGDYFMGAWVDDLGEIRESREDDNFSASSASSRIQNTASDLSVDFWFAPYDANGDGSFEYDVSNAGAANIAADAWQMSLWLTTDETFTSAFQLVNDPGIALAPGSRAVRDQANPKSYNLFRTVQGNSVPAGEYLVVAIADPFQTLTESNELNNTSFSVDGVSLSSGKSFKNHSDTERINFNGRRLPSGNIKWERIRISSDASGQRNIAKLATVPRSEALPDAARASAVQKASNHLIFPVAGRTAMPLTSSENRP